MRYTRTLTAVLAAGLLTVGCGSSDSGDGKDDKNASPAAGSSAPANEPAQDDDAFEGEQLPSPVESPAEEPVRSAPSISPSPDRSATITDKVVYELQQRTVQMAGVLKDTTGTCAGGELTMKAGATTECKVTYDGVDVPWDVTIGDNYKEGSFVVSYRVAPKKALLVGEGVKAAFWTQQSSTSDDLRCDDLPKAELVEVDQDSGYKCQYLIKRDGGPDEYSDRVVKIGERRISFDLP
ncbi:hypothetical protein QNO07_08525 [Streptomyces sp. 549]|uniref:hypothetical protein n=1 Tax=Streptomyces sp. 549 TaxID=3049076 RepID=UPI0024C26303|nr:hypothetical protein [Streptomyces sp. 549]MDK1473460.1 hypothetical protein [Streptomyces sp. 549]